MKIWVCLLLFLGVLGAYDEIVLTQKQIDSLGISVVPLDKKFGTKGLPFNAVIDFNNSNPKHTVIQSLSFNATVVAIYKSEGEYVKRGDLICEISSIDLSNLYFQLQNSQNKLKVALDVSSKDYKLYKQGVIAKREYQNSHLISEEMRLRVRQLEDTFRNFGIDPKKPMGLYGFKIIARNSGVLSIAPKVLGEKILPFTTYIRIAENNDLIARIKLPVSLSRYIKKGSHVLDALGNKIGVIQSISVVLDRNSNTILATAFIDAHNYHVGEVVDVYIEGFKPKNSLIVPSSAIIRNDQDYLMFIRTPKGFMPTPVQIIEERTRVFVISNKNINPHAKVAAGALVSLKGILNNLGDD
ncbi:nickel-cobalt-cadmium resistance protein (nccB) [Helicobacter bizzozeronii CIII-1]|uniref:Nickel-cobalt-cadmium resistance protein (NccB) n=1 Tax=Helicobacter bizzozeronii (strain CIII-1) TaxID=1002804 RepID=F8KTT3_HELBC|nr:sodium:proton antiporter [Helicobacter bizzozeronii]CCB80253.1 nickel-cobalt-cadmium resistance protein (nccB) [Helicobacter bizzozeronii CIII-1]